RLCGSSPNGSGWPIPRRGVGQPFCLIAFCVVAGAALADPPVLRYADTLKAYSQGPGAEPGYITPAAALGEPATRCTPIAPQNNASVSGPRLVVSLGQRGSITLGFNSPVENQDPSIRNPYGYDILAWGNCFQGPAATTFEGDNGRFEEPGFIEVAQADAQGN